MHHAFGIAFIVAAIAFAFGERTARAVVGAGLILGIGAVLYVSWLVVSGSI